MSSLPTLSHMEFFVLKIVEHDTHSGSYLRSRLLDVGDSVSPAKFYQFMTKIEKTGAVEGWYEPEEIAGQVLKLRHFKATPRGVGLLNESRAFYK